MDDADLSQKGRTNTPVKEKPACAEDSNVSFDDLMSRIRHIVLTNRLRVCKSLSYDANLCRMMQICCSSHGNLYSSSLLQY